MTDHQNEAPWPVPTEQPQQPPAPPHEDDQSWACQGLSIGEC